MSRKEYMREYMKKKRDVNKGANTTEEVNKEVNRLEGLLQEHSKRVVVLAEALTDSDKRDRLVKIHKALGRDVAGLARTVHLRDEVRYGIDGFTFSEIGELLGA